MPGKKRYYQHLTKIMLDQHMMMISPLFDMEHRNKTFGEAITTIENGKRAWREAWNGKGMYIWLLPAAVVKKEWVRDPLLLAAIGSRDEINCRSRSGC